MVKAIYTFTCCVCGEIYHAKYQGHDLHKRPRCVFCEKKPEIWKPQEGETG